MLIRLFSKMCWVLKALQNRFPTSTTCSKLRLVKPLPLLASSWTSRKRRFWPNYSQFNRPSPSKPKNVLPTTSTVPTPTSKTTTLSVPKSLQVSKPEANVSTPPLRDSNLSQIQLLNWRRFRYHNRVRFLRQHNNRPFSRRFHGL